MNSADAKVENAAVTATVDMTFAGSETDEAIVATFTYNVYEPFQVAAAFTIGGASTVQWVMGRDLLREGVVLPTGLGDIRVYPVADTLYVELTSPSGRAILEGPIDPIIAFVEAVFAAVPEGREQEYFSIDAELDLFVDLRTQLDGDSAS